VILTSVPRAEHVKDVFLNPETGVLAAEKPADRKILFLELSTIDPAVSVEIAEAVTRQNFGEFVDAPCSVWQLGFLFLSFPCTTT
jgi:3-hydroxyisobutyrate dehydrogenase-like beta-hydroxyacid dehydrogenase